MSSSPLPIRRAGPNDRLSASAKDMLVATPSGNLYGKSPGGSRIVYSREQLLSLASSPLSQTPPLIPAEISRSPEKTSVLRENNRSNGAVGVGKGAVNGLSGVGLGKSSGGTQSAASEVFRNGSSNGMHLNGHANGVTRAAAVPRSPPAMAGIARSPGNAFNFTNGPVSPNGIMPHSTSFKERMAAAQQQQEERGGRSARQVGDGDMPSSSNGINDGANGAHADEQFNMEM